jgi:hypothetical protein
MAREINQFLGLMSRRMGMQLLVLGGYQKEGGKVGAVQ